jgi:hypothetical protein
MSEKEGEVGEVGETGGEVGETVEAGEEDVEGEDADRNIIRESIDEQEVQPKEKEVSDGSFVFSPDPSIAEIQRKVIAVFEIFDVGSQKIVDVREVGTMSRALGQFSAVKLLDWSRLYG